ncbi:putative DNA binding domain-containing protein [Lentzea alba]|uniref:ATP-binding protein n=1 Tax=Lentzea alba TaxID=2714351 RepID=UPI0039BED007
METSTLQSLIERLRRTGAEMSEVEVESSAGGLPRSAAETMSEFANTNGGTLVLGLDEADGFRPVHLADPAKLRDDLAALASDCLHPPLRIAVEVVELEGMPLVVAEIDPLPSDHRPCYVDSKGIATGSYVRVGDGDRRMTQAEIGLAIANRGQPRYDLEAVPEAVIGDLDRVAFGRTIERVRQTSRAFRDMDEVTALERLRVLVRTENGTLVPSLGGLLTFGVYPQQHFPQLTVSVVVYSGAETGPRFDDNPVIRGPIPELVSETMAVLRRHMRVRTHVDGSGRREQLDYPMEAVREAVVNALLHRDYSGGTRGTQVQIELHPDRLLVRSPGGLFGPVVLEDLGTEGVSSSRNAFLASLLSDTYLPASDGLVAENRASGVPAMIRELQRSGLARPIFRNFANRFEVEFSRSELLDPATRQWLAQLREPGLTQLHELALATMYHGRPISNAALRQFGASQSDATSVLRDLVNKGLAVRTGGRRYATYSLGASAETLDLFTIASPQTDVAEVLRTRLSASAKDLIAATGYSRPTVLLRLEELIQAGLVRAEGAPNSPKRRYLWTGGR